jgi:hypothetical protein
MELRKRLGGITSRRSRRRDSASPAVPPVPGAMGLPAVPASKPARRRTARLARTLRTRWWPRFLLAGALLVIVSVTLLSGAAAAWAGISGAAIVTVTVFRAASMKPDEYMYEPPVPPGGTSGL